MDYQRLCQYHRNIKATEYLFQRIIHDFDEWECLKKNKKQKKSHFFMLSDYTLRATHDCQYTPISTTYGLAQDLTRTPNLFINKITVHPKGTNH